VQTGLTAANKLSSSLAEGCDTLILQRTTKRATEKLHIGYAAETNHSNPYKKDNALAGKSGF